MIERQKASGGAPPPLKGVLETALYVGDMARSVAFFEHVLGRLVLLRTDRLTAFDAGRNSVLLVFARGASKDDIPSPAGTIPGHDGAGPLHMAFAIEPTSYECWRDHLSANAVPIRSEVHWPRGGRSLYFEDPDGHVLELATPGVWENY